MLADCREALLIAGEAFSLPRSSSHCREALLNEAPPGNPQEAELIHVACQVPMEQSRDPSALRSAPPPPVVETGWLAPAGCSRPAGCRRPVWVVFVIVSELDVAWVGPEAPSAILRPGAPAVFGFASRLSSRPGPPRRD